MNLHCISEAFGFRSVDEGYGSGNLFGFDGNGEFLSNGVLAADYDGLVILSGFLDKSFLIDFIFSEEVVSADIYYATGLYGLPCGNLFHRLGILFLCDFFDDSVNLGAAETRVGQTGEYVCSAFDGGLLVLCLEASYCDADRRVKTV